MKKIAIGFGALFAVLLMFGACGVALSGGPSRPVESGVGSDVPVAGQAVPVPTWRAEQAPAQVPATDYPGLGGSFQADDGLIITLVSIEPYKPSNSAAGDDQARNVLVTTKIRNEGMQTYEFNDLVVGPTVTHNGVPASSITDIGKLDVVPLSNILPGRELSFKSAFSIGPKGEMQLEYQTEIWGENAIFVTEY